MNIKEAAESWVDSFNAIQQAMIAKLIQNDPDEWLEVTRPLVGNVVHVYDLCANGEIVKSYIKDDEHIFDIEFFDSKLISSLPRHAFEVMFDFTLPMCGTMWSFNDSADNWWLVEGDGIGYDFFECHWIPLYNARGLQWHIDDNLN